MSLPNRLYCVTLLTLAYTAAAVVVTSPTSEHVTESGDSCSPLNGEILSRLWHRTYASLSLRARVSVAKEIHIRLAAVAKDADRLLFDDRALRTLARAATVDSIMADDRLKFAYLDTLVIHDFALNSLTSKPVLGEYLLHVARSRRAWMKAPVEYFTQLGNVISSCLTSFILETDDSLLVESCVQEYMTIAKAMSDIAANETIYAICEIERGISDPAIRGTVYFKQKSIGGDTTIVTNLRGFSYEDDDFLHGIHIHHSGDVSEGCEYTGEHYNPTGVQHGEPLYGERHLGDLGNIEEDDYGVCRNTHVDSHVTLTGDHSVVGRSLVIDKYEDAFFSGRQRDEKLGCCRIRAVRSDHHGRNTSPDVRARCQVTGDTGSHDQDIEGDIYLRQSIEGGPLHITIDLDGFDPDDEVNWHGFHIHERAALGRECSDAGSHFNGASGYRRGMHAHPSNPNRHLGDLGNIQENGNGIIKRSFTDRVASLIGEDSIIGRSMVIHRQSDKAALDPHIYQVEPEIAARLACCLIVEEFDTNHN